MRAPEFTSYFDDQTQESAAFADFDVEREMAWVSEHPGAILIYHGPIPDWIVSQAISHSVLDILRENGRLPMNINLESKLTPDVSAAIDDMFEYHKWNEDQIAKGSRVREALANAVKVIVENVPSSPDRTVAIRKIREARMDANSAITHSGKY